MSDDKYEYFISQTNDRLEKIDDKLGELLAFKWQMFGSVMLGSFVLTVSINIAVIVFSK